MSGVVGGIGGFSCGFGCFTSVGVILVLFILLCNCFSCIYLLVRSLARPASIPMEPLHYMPFLFSRAILFGIMYTNPEEPVKRSSTGIALAGLLFLLQIKNIQ